MTNFKAIPAFLTIFAVSLAPLGCGDDTAEDRSALADEELGRELELALQGDTLLTSFEDSLALPEEEEPEPVRAAPQPVPQRQAPRAQPRPEPVRQAPQRDPAPTPAPAPQPRVVSESVPVGTSLALRLNEELSTETSRAGDGFTATLSEPILSASGAVLVPAGATVRGSVTGVNKSGRVGETAVLKLAFQSISFGGRDYPMSATVVNANPERVNRTSTKEQAAKVAAGAAAGAILGKVLGKDTGATIKGAVVGAAAGTAIAMGTADVDAVLPAGSRLVIRLDEPVEVRRTVS